MKAILVKSQQRFESFHRKLDEYGAETTVINLGETDWVTRDFSGFDILIFCPMFQFKSNSPHAVAHVVDFIKHMSAKWPNLAIFPDPRTIDYYNDKYRQFLFLQSRGFPIPKTVPLLSETALDLADRTLGYPMVLKNRHGAGGGFVFQVRNKAELLKYYKLSMFDFWGTHAAGHFLSQLRKRVFYYHLIKARKLAYPFYSPPLIAQQLVKTDRDVRVVVGNGKVVEAHWRIQTSADQWKVNIDGGGIGEWSAFPQDVLDLAVAVTKQLKTSGWLGLDMLRTDSGFLITEFSPVWHHYAYREKPSFVYKDDYNVDVPLEVSLDLERIIVEYLVDRVRTGREALGTPA